MKPHCTKSIQMTCYLLLSNAAVFQCSQMANSYPRNAIKVHKMNGIISVCLYLYN